MSEIVDRLARILSKECLDGCENEGYIDPCVTKLCNCRRVARAQIEAIREPTEAMQLAGHNKQNDPMTGFPTHCGIDEIYTAMIDATLRDQ